MHIRNRFILRSSIAAALLTSVSATAADNTPTDLAAIEQVVVTGSYIEGVAEDAACDRDRSR